MRLLDQELQCVRDDRVVRHIQTLLVKPKAVARAWDYGAPDQHYLCWTVLDDSAGSDTGIAYCEEGFGPHCPWGLVYTGRERDRASMRMDSGWFSTFMEAYFDSFAAASLPIWRVFSMDGGRPAQPLTEELSWDEAWKRCDDARKSALGAHFMVHHTIVYGGVSAGAQYWRE